MGQHVLTPTRNPDSLHYSILQLVRSLHVVPISQLIECSLGWFPILFFTSVWVSEIYKQSVSSAGIDSQTFTADAVRAGNRALFFQALVTIAFSIGAPFLISESGVQVSFNSRKYESLNGAEEYSGNGNGHYDISNGRRGSKARYTSREGIKNRIMMLVMNVVERARSGRMLELPIQGFTLIRLWYASMFCFAIAMGLSW